MNVLRRPTNVAAAFLIVSAIGIAAVLGLAAAPKNRHRPLPPGTIGAVDAPWPTKWSSASGIRISGWALDPVGDARGSRFASTVERVPGALRHRAPVDVAQLKPGYPDSAEAGFFLRGRFRDSWNRRVHEIAIVGRQSPGRRDVACAQEPRATQLRLAQWQPLYESRHGDAASSLLCPARSLRHRAGRGGRPRQGVFGLHIAKREVRDAGADPLFADDARQGAGLGVRSGLEHRAPLRPTSHRRGFPVGA
jgi:hypothetical protein